MGYSVRPVGNHFPWPDRRSLAGENEENGLKSILGVMVIAEETAADAPHHRSMPADERLDRRLFMPGDKAL
jgi:hypothetical protein